MAILATALEPSARPRQATASLQAPPTLRAARVSVVTRRVKRIVTRPLLVAAGCACLVVSSSWPAAAQLGSSAPPGQVGRPLGSGSAGRSRNPASANKEVEEFGRNLQSDDPGTRLDAVKSLGASQEKGAIQYLIQATADPDPRVKLKAIDSLGALRASDATPVLVQALYLRDTQPWLKQRLLVSLGKIGDNRATRPIADSLARETDVPTLGTAIFALGEIGDTQAIADLQRVAGTSADERLQQLAQDAIGKIRQKQINPEVQVKALREREGEEARPATASAGPPVAY